MHALVPLVVLANAAVLVLGETIANLAYRASRRTGSTALSRLAAGFAIVTLGAAVGGAVHQLAAVNVVAAVFAQSLVAVVGFAVIAHSLYVETPEAAARTRRPD